MLVGVVSDTHSYFNPRVAELLQGVGHIIHAGDIGDPGIIDQLSSIAPVTTVRGNNDKVGPSSLFPEEVTLEIGGRIVYITHQIKVPKVPGDAAHQRYTDAGIDVVVYGHSHIGFQKTFGSVLFFNPGAAGKPRFKLISTVGTLEITEDSTVGTIIPL